MITAWNLLLLLIEREQIWAPEQCHSVLINKFGSFISGKDVYTGKRRGEDLAGWVCVC